jgi:hypothetical protein
MSQTCSRAVTARPTRIVMLAVASGVLLTAGCAQNVQASAAPESPFTQRAKSVTSAWRATASATGDGWRTGFVPTEDLTIPPKDGLTGGAKTAFLSGWYTLRADLTAQAPAQGVVTYPDKTTLSVPLVSAQAAYAAIDKGDPSCATTGAAATQTCTALTVTAARLDTTTLHTTGGVATVPAWLFTVAGLAQPVVRVAVAPAAVVALPSASAGPVPSHQAGTLRSAGQLTGETAGTLSYTIEVGACDKNPTPQIYEAKDVVVVGATVDPPSTGLCIARADTKLITAHLASEIGTRVVLDAVSGRVLTFRPTFSG